MTRCSGASHSIWVVGVGTTWAVVIEEGSERIWRQLPDPKIPKSVQHREMFDVVLVGFWSLTLAAESFLLRGAFKNALPLRFSLHTSERLARTPYRGA